MVNRWKRNSSAQRCERCDRVALIAWFNGRQLCLECEEAERDAVLDLIHGEGQVMDFEIGVICPWCDSEQDYDVAFLGKLGALAHFRCRHCGADFSETQPEGDDRLSEMANFFTPDQGGEA